LEDRPVIASIWKRIRCAFTPVREVDRRPDPKTDPVGARYVRSFLVLRILVGLIGLALAPLVVLVEHYGYGGTLFPRDSVSIYYYTGMHDVFVAALAAMGIFFITYKVAECSLDSTASTLAGAGAILISQFPTAPPMDVPVGYPTPLQGAVGVQAASSIHYTASAVFLVGLTVMSFFFARREGTRPRREGQRFSGKAWRNLHYACSGALVLALLWVAFTSWVWHGGPYYTLLVGEALAASAFGISWLAKGSELDMLFGTPRPEIEPREPSMNGPGG
jgi:hypothetical protein